MHKRISTFVIAAVACQCALLADSHQTGTITWNPRYESFACDSALTVNVFWTSARLPDFILGLEPDAALDGRVALALASVVPLRADPAPNKTFTNMAGRIQETAPCTFRITSGISERERLVLHARIKPGTRVVLTVNDQTSTNFVVSQGAIIYDSKIVVDSGALHVLKALAVAYSRGFDNGPELARDSRGRYNIMPKGFRNHLIETQEISFASRIGRSADCCAQAAMVTFKVTVSPEGSVLLAVPGNGSADLLAKLAPLVQSLKLKPFISVGVPVYAEGYLTLLVERSGRVSYLY
jgi:hypothetical protein